MEKTIHIGGVSFPARSTAASFISYKANFHRDGMRDLLRLAKSFPANKQKLSDDAVMSIIAENEDFDLDIFTRFLWVFAKSADKSIPPLEEWLDSLNVPPFDFLMETFPQVQDLLFSNLQTGVQAKNSQAAAEAAK